MGEGGLEEEGEGQLQAVRHPPPALSAAGQCTHAHERPHVSCAYPPYIHADARMPPSQAHPHASAPAALQQQHTLARPFEAAAQRILLLRAALECPQTRSRRAPRRPQSVLTAFQLPLLQRPRIRPTDRS